jgi:hypothetical protein
MILLAQILGVIAFLFAISSFQMKTQKRLVLLQIISTTFFTVHFLLLEALAGALFNLIGILRAIVFFHRGKNRFFDSVLWVFFFSALSLGVCIYTWDNAGFLTLLPFVGMVCTTVAFYITDAKLTRLISFPSSPAWLIYNAFQGSLGGILTECVAMCSIVIGFLRHDIKRKRNTQ